MLIDREGNLWTGLASIGPDITNLQPRPFRRVIRSLGRHGGGELLVNCIFRDGNGRTWIGSAGGLFQLDPQTGLTTFVPVTQKGMSPGVTSIDEDNAGNLWLATVGQGLKQFDPARKQVIRSFVHAQDNAASLSSDVVTSLRYDSGTLWLSTWDGFDQLDTLTGRFQVYKRDMRRLTEPYGRFARDDHGRFWIGSDSGLVRFDPATRRFIEFLHTANVGAISNDHVSSVYIDSRGRVWATTQSGLDELDGEASFSTYRPADGLGGIAFSCVLEDDTGELWVGSNKGISRFSPTAHTFTNYSDADGIGDLTGLRSAPGACSKDRDGQMFFGGFSGLYSFQARNIRDRNSDAPVRIVDFRLNGQSTRIGSEVTLTHDLRNFSVEFASLNFLDTAATRYRYSLSGLDSRWNYVGSDQRSVNYISLPTGAYIFNVQAAVGRGDWSSLGASLRIRILPPWWQTWWFRAAAGCAGVLLLWIAWSYRLRTLERDYEVRLNERVFERTRIARELHDSLLQGFQGVMLRLQGVRELLPGRVSDAVQMLEDALDSGDQAIIEGREAVQNLRTSASANFDLEGALKSLGTELLTGDAQNDISFRVVVQGKSRALAPLTQDEIYQIAREAFRNALRHAHASNIELELEYGDSVFRLRLRDDGKGIDAGALARATAGKHWGVQGMRERAASLGGRLEIWAQAGAGTEVFLEIPTHSSSSRSAPRRPPDRTKASQDA
jgi:signal transduction histidine kinase/streptogramin lyase